MVHNNVITLRARFHADLMIHHLRQVEISLGKWWVGKENVVKNQI